jgi:hypothetical protein
MNYHPTTNYQTEEAKSLTAYENKAGAALLRSRVLVELAKSQIKAAVNEAIGKCDPLVNNELLELYQTQRRAKAFLTPEGRETLLEAVFQAVDEHYFLALNLMSEESNEQ